MTDRAEWTVVKVGGSLLDWPALPEALRAFLDDHRDDRLVMIVGGGAAADLVRDLDRIHNLGEVRAHALAIRSLDLTARVLAAIVPGLVVVETIADLQGRLDGGGIPILAPRRPLEDDALRTDDPLPTSWSVTTDAIAARIATRIGASCLILLKSTSAPPGTTREQAARLGLVDPRFPHEARPIPRVVLRNLRGPQGQTGGVLPIEADSAQGS